MIRTLRSLRDSGACVQLFRHASQSTELRIAAGS
jgi:hypothetical protein